VWYEDPVVTEPEKMTGDRSLKLIKRIFFLELRDEGHLRAMEVVQHFQCTRGPSGAINNIKLGDKTL
jgi:hypothetical protein